MSLSTNPPLWASGCYREAVPPEAHKGQRSTRRVIGWKPIPTTRGEVMDDIVQKQLYTEWQQKIKHYFYGNCIANIFDQFSKVYRRSSEYGDARGQHFLVGSPPV